MKQLQQLLKWYCSILQKIESSIQKVYLRPIYDQVPKLASFVKQRLVALDSKCLFQNKKTILLIGQELIYHLDRKILSQE